MDSLRKLPEAKYAMDDLMDRTFNAEKKLIDHKQEIIRMTKKLLKMYLCYKYSLLNIILMIEIK